MLQLVSQPNSIFYICFSHFRGDVGDEQQESNAGVVSHAHRKDIHSGRLQHSLHFHLGDVSTTHAVYAIRAAIIMGISAYAVVIPHARVF